MSEDIVTRLRDFAEHKTPLWDGTNFTVKFPIMAEAADEIEGLREALAMANKFAEGWHKRALKAEGHA